MKQEEYGKMRDQEDHYWWFISRRKLALALLDPVLNLNPRAKILDVGCGTGAMLQALDGQCDATGLDFSEDALRYCRERGLTHLIHGNAEQIPLGSNRFDAVVSLDTIEHVPGDAAAASEIFRVLKPGGVFVMNVPAYKWLWGPHDIALMHQRRYTTREVRRLLENAGFRLERVSYSVFFLFPVVAVRRFFEKFHHGPAQVKLPEVSEGTQARLIRLMDREAALFRRMNLPWGSSVVAVARKPKDSA